MPRLRLKLEVSESQFLDQDQKLISSSLNVKTETEFLQASIPKK